MRDASNVYSIGYTTGATMGNRLLGVFDGSSWRADRIPSHCGDYLADVVGTASGFIYTNATRFSPTLTRHICRVSTALSSWESVGEVAFNGDREGSLVATAGGTVVAIWGNYMVRSSPAMVATVRDNTTIAHCTLSPGLGKFVAWSAPGSPNVHIFTGEPAGTTRQTGRHLVKRFDP